ncbi:DUF4405 domain-containing protein [Solidesulfovibrio alcoholivorans]|uniref:DUF4405 domain-containing protein n=1 Tax=Solidesulfovibrio alcoholivorans TaxID=81406 RepID=UPI00049803B6|nr:DUF4405 domain-containing protein [Solidesulfovibrio alcoholivorans]
MTRKITSLVAFLSFILTAVTSIILYIAPQGRVAYWSDWTLWGMDKTQWGNLHINLGFLFLLSLALHAYYNWKAILAYCSRARHLVLVTPASAAAFAIVALTALGTLGLTPPFSWVLDGGTYFKDRAARAHGEPPFGHAELAPLTLLAPAVGMTPEALVAALRQAGFSDAAPDATLLTLARSRHTSPQRILARVLPATSSGELPQTPPPGTGSLALEELCRRYGLSPSAVVAALAEQGIAAAPGETLKAIAEKNGKTPVAVYAAIRQAAAPAAP